MNIHRNLEAQREPRCILFVDTHVASYMYRYSHIPNPPSCTSWGILFREVAEIPPSLPSRRQRNALAMYMRYKRTLLYFLHSLQSSSQPLIISQKFRNLTYLEFSRVRQAYEPLVRRCYLERRGWSRHKLGVRHGL